LPGYTPGVLAPLALAVFLATPSRAGEGVHYLFEHAPGVAEADCADTRRLVAAVYDDLPGLFDPASLERFLCTPPMDNAFYDPGEKRIRLDPVYLRDFAAQNPGFIRAGEEARAVVIHELAHAFVVAHPGQDEIYREVVSRNRLKRFKRRYYRPGRRSARLSLIVHNARRRMGIGDDTKEEYVRTCMGQDGNTPEACAEEWEELTSKLELKEAQRLFETINPRLQKAELRTYERTQARKERLTEKLRIPRRNADDLHATDADTEWFAYGAEIYFHAADPDEWLAPEEKQWWKSLEAAFKTPRPPLTLEPAARRAASISDSLR
jgi:hypothetical protein